MTYIDPKWFYWLEVIDKLGGFIFGLVFILIAIAMLTLVIFGKEYMKKSITMLIVAGILITVNIFIPTKQTLIQMKVAESMTYENVEIATETIKDTVDYIFDKLKGN